MKKLLASVLTLAVLMGLTLGPIGCDKPAAPKKEEKKEEKKDDKKEDKKDK